ncbi:uncharacterized protein EV420DRAFT_1475962 [Desarmillaria tabescens]|uniref:Uncharacterized protein n=1 Tax=Armillaria tabescens TaxID=1929756 RepID=A0AA39NF63_ARMTA|nr:uncharacterized protein EV420DRAFT_1475962 [Desarmillaria tabescens]KAK0464508.1 hypothetical protein EV420DRAFT_1475962 [Desarmillaria tabescens]
MQLLRLLSSLLVLSTTLSLPVSVSAGNGEITSPTNGTVVMPGESFDFKYDGMADYSVSGYNYSVCPSHPLSPLAPGTTLDDTDYANYPGVPYANHPAPAQLVMPNLSARLGGFGTGKSASNALVYLAVIEEWASGSTFGFQMNLAMTQLIYNGTSSS